MSVLVPITVEGTLVDRPELGQTEHRHAFCRFTLKVQDRRCDEAAAGRWEDNGDTVRHRATVSVRSFRSKGWSSADYGFAVYASRRCVIEMMSIRFIRSSSW